MKRTISLIIAIAVMISMFVLPASAAEYIVDMSTLNGASAFTVAVNIPIPGITLSDIGLHFQTGEPGATNGNTVDIPLDLSGYNTMTITYRTGAAVGVECEKLMLQKADYSASYSTFDIKGSGGWGTTAEASIDVSAITEGTTNYRLTLQNNGTGNGLFVTGIKLTGEGTGSTDPVTPPPASGTITAPSQFVAGTTNVLSQNIEGAVTLSSGTYVIDLAGYEWKNATNPNGGLTVSGAHVTVIDSSANKTGKINSPVSDAVVVNSGTFVAEGITILGAPVSGDAIFVNGGTVVSNNSNLSAGKAGIDVVSSSASVTVNGGSFPAFTGAVDERNSAIELRWNAKVTLNGDIDFTVNRIVARKTQDNKPCHTNAIADSIIIADSSASATFTAETAVVNPYPNYNVTEITYTYTTAAADPAFVGASVTLSSGIALNFIAEGVDADDYIVVKGNQISGVAGTGEYAGMYIFSVDNFGPQAIGDDITAELYADGALVGELTYSVKDYCYDVINDANSSAELVKLAKALLNYGAASQVFKNYKVNALVNADLTAAEKDIATNYIPWRGAATVAREKGFKAQYTWRTANVYFGNTYKLIITFTTSPINEVTATPSHVLYTNLDGVTPDIRKEITEVGTDEVTGKPVYQIVFDDILPTEFDKDYLLSVYDADGNKLANFLNYSLRGYVSMNDNENRDNEYNSAGLVEPVGAINDLVKAFQMYCIAAINYEKTL